MITIKELNNIENVLDLLSEQPFVDTIKRNRASFLYRGLSNNNYHLETSLHRNCKGKEIQIEKSLLRNFTKYAATDAPELKTSIWQQLIIGQHHGLPTRLMDWTYSPLVGLNFATCVANLSDMSENDGVLWKIDISEINNLLPNKYKEMLNKENAYLFTVDMLKELELDLDRYDIDMSNKSFVLLEPPSIDQRIINQYSYFSVVPMGINNFELFLDQYTQNSVKYIINKDLKWRIRDMLDQLNINERTMYPGLDGLSSWLKRHYYVK